MLRPLSASKWNDVTAAHLLNRAGFGGTPEDVKKLVALGPEKAVRHFLDFEKVADDAVAPEWADKAKTMELAATLQRLNEQAKAAKTEEEKQRTLAARQDFTRLEQRGQQRDIVDLRAWWLRRMAFGPRPLQEKMTLFWHGHFATSAVKVRAAYLMYLQNETFRRHCFGNWLDLLEAVTKDPAMLIWLDQAQSKKEHPNENYAREVMELFALGEGHYTEKDVTEAARALTGYSFDRAKLEYLYRPYFHDDGTKTVLGKTGEFGGMDVLEIIATHPQSAKFLSAKLWKFFASENAPPEVVDALAAVFTKNNRSFKPLLQALFLSEEFYAPTVIRAQVKSPVQWLVSSVRMLDRSLPEPLVCTTMLRQLGQELFVPPNVKGWDGGLSWISTNSLLDRYNLAASLVLAQAPPPDKNAGDNKMRQVAEDLSRRMIANGPLVDVSKLLTDAQRKHKELVIPALEKRFLQAKLKDKPRQALQDFLDGRGELDDDDIRHTIRLLMSTPEFQLT